MLIEAVAAIFDDSISLPASLLVSDANADYVFTTNSWYYPITYPEMPFMLVPVLLIMACTAIFYIRNYSIAVARS